jgi:ribosome modulation factor
MGNFMQVEAVLRYLKKKALALPQYIIEGCENHFFSTEDLKTKIDPQLFRIMQCEVTTYMVVTTKEENTNAYNRGWNANIADKSIFTNPETNLTLGKSWAQGWKDCAKEWDKLPSFKSQPDKK